MTTISESAMAYEPKQTKNISELDVVRTDAEIQDGDGIDKDNKPFYYKYILVENEEYRIPNMVLEQLKSILQAKPGLKTFKVTRSGTGMATRYQVIALD